jgi:hypothetical protein
MIRHARFTGYVTFRYLTKHHQNTYVTEPQATAIPCTNKEKTLNITAFRDVTQCSLVAHYQQLGGTCVTAGCAKMLVTIYQTTRHPIPEDSNLYRRCCEHLKSHKTPSFHAECVNITDLRFRKSTGTEGKTWYKSHGKQNKHMLKPELHLYCICICVHNNQFTFCPLQLLFLAWHTLQP